MEFRTVIRLKHVHRCVLQVEAETIHAEDGHEVDSDGAHLKVPCRNIVCVISVIEIVLECAAQVEINYWAESQAIVAVATELLME